LLLKNKMIDNHINAGFKLQMQLLYLQN